MCNVERMYNVQSTVWKECALCYLHPAAPHVRHSRVTLSAANDLAGAFAGVPPRWPTHPDLSVFSTFGHPFSGAAPIGPKSNQVWFSVPWHGTTRATWQTWLMSKQQLGTWHQIGRHWAVCVDHIGHHWAVCGSDWAVCVDQMGQNLNPPWRHICLLPKPGPGEAQCCAIVIPDHIKFPLVI